MNKKLSIVILILLSLSFISCGNKDVVDNSNVGEQEEQIFNLQRNIPQVANLGRAKVVFDKDLNKEGYYLVYGRDDIEGRIKVTRSGEKVVNSKVTNNDVCVVYLKIDDVVEFENCSNYFIQKDINISEEDINNYIDKKFNL